MITRELQILWWDWLSSAERLLRSLAEQTTALTRRDPQRLEELQPEVERLMTILHQLDESAVAATKKLAGELGVEPRFRSIVAALKPAEANQVQILATRVRAVSQNVSATLAKNKALIDSEVAYVNGTLAIVADVLQQSDAPSYAGRTTRDPALVNQVA